MRMLILVAAVVAAGSSGLAAAPADTARGLQIAQPVLRVASPVSKTGAGYMAITNRGRSADRLLAVTTTASTRADLHGTISIGAVTQMRAQSGGVPIRAGATVTFAPGGLHVMFIGLKTPMPAGGLLRARLIFEKARPIDVAFKAQTAAGSLAR